MWWKVPAQFVLMAVLVVTFVPPSTLASPVAQEARELTLLVGAGQDTVSAEGFFPATVRVRAGDRVTWRINSDADHTVSFIGDLALTWVAGAPMETYRGSTLV